MKNLKYKLMGLLKSLKLGDFNFMVRYGRSKAYAVATVKVHVNRLR